MPGRIARLFLIVQMPPIAADVVISAAGAMPGDARLDSLIVLDYPHSSDGRSSRFSDAFTLLMPD